MKLEVYTTPEKVTVFETIGGGSSTFVHFCFEKKNRKLFLINIFSYNRIQYPFVGYGPEPFGKVPDRQSCQKGRVGSYFIGGCFLLLIFSNKHGGLNTKLRVTKDVK